MHATFPSTPNVSSLLNEGIRALHSQDKARARALLSEVVALDPRSEQAWLWLSGAVETDAERVRCLEQVLALNPHSQPALQGLRMIAAARAAPTAPVAASAAPLSLSADAIFDRDRFLLRQEIAVREKYRVWDEFEQPLLYIERPRHVLRNVVGVLAVGIVAALVCIVFLVSAVQATALLPRLMFGLLTVIAFGFLLVMPVLVSKKRHTTIYRDERKQQPVVRILQDYKFRLINATYTITDADGQVLARLRKNYLYNLVRRRWYCYSPDQALLCVAKEDSLVRSILRRLFLQTGLLGVLFMTFVRTNFVILAGDSVTRLGVFNRKMTILDRYVLDMSADPARTLDRRVALALGVMLDTGERR